MGERCSRGGQDGNGSCSQGCAEQGRAPGAPVCARRPVPTCTAQPVLGGSRRHQARPGLISRPVNYSCSGCLLPRASRIHPGLQNNAPPSMTERPGAAALGSQAARLCHSLALLCIVHPLQDGECSWKLQHGRLFVPGLENGPHEKKGKFREPPVLTCQGGIRMHQAMRLPVPAVLPISNPSPNFHGHLSKHSTWI